MADAKKPPAVPDAAKWAGIGIGSAAIVAALLYANRGKDKRKPDALGPNTPQAPEVGPK